MLGRGDQRVAPVYVDDVAEVAVRAALDLSSPAGTFGLGGPEVLTLSQVIDLVNGRHLKQRHLPAAAAKVFARALPTLNPALVDVLLTDSLPPAPSASDAFCVQLHRPPKVLTGAER